MNCNPGYASELPPMTRCVDGNYEPLRPEQFKCTESVALIVSRRGEVEVFGQDEKCNQMMANRPQLSEGGHSVNLISNSLVIGTSGDPKGGWRYHIIVSAPFEVAF